MKKIINEPDDLVDEVIDGLLLAHSDELRAVSADRRALVRTDAGTGGRVGIVTGGGSGHIPLFLGYVGHGLASGVAVGNIFSSPSADQIHAATIASDDGAGVLYLYGNYGGDVYNFDLAADLSTTDGIRTSTVLGTDDILSAPTNRSETRRGVAGLVLAYKTAGAAAEQGHDLESVTDIAKRTVAHTRTMGVGLSPAILPAAGEPTFTLEDGEMEIGIGIHGEPGQHRGPLEKADAITERFVHELLKELDLQHGDRVAVLVNGLGATPTEELYLIYRRAHQILTERGVTIHRKYIGEYATSLEMAGASLSILHLDDELAELVDAPASSPFFSQGSLTSHPQEPQQSAAESTKDVRPSKTSRPKTRTVSDPGNLRNIVLGVTDRLPAHSDELRDLDAAIGDGDLGITVGAGARAVHRAVEDLPPNAHPAEIFKTMGSTFAAANPSTYAALLGAGMVAASSTLAESTRITTTNLTNALRALLEKIQKQGKAEPGDKTVIDVIIPVLEALTLHATETAKATANACLEAAETAVDESIDRVSKRGRASWIGDRSVGHRDPGSVAFLRIIEEITQEISPKTATRRP